jgi:SAM-dependent methyltransferase
MSGTASETSERIVPGQQGSLRQHLLLLRHEFAYAFARQRLPREAKVLEIGCGAGYGSEQLDAPGGPGSVAAYLGLDVDAATVAHASAASAAPKRRFECYDGERIPAESGSFDFALSFQVIEHVDDDRRFVAEIRRVLADDGHLVLTTPNRLTRVQPGRRPWNRYHVREYAPAELAERLRAEFAHVELLGVRGSEAAERIEHGRLRTIRKLSSVDVFGLRDRVPEWLRQVVARAAEYRSPTVESAVERFSVADFRTETGALDDSLDLLAVCRGRT